MNSTLIKNSMLYTVLLLFQKAVGFFLMPVYTSLLSPSDYGIINLVSTLVGFLSVFYNLSLHGAASRYNFKYDSPLNRNRVWSTCIITVSVNSIIVLAIILGFHDFLINSWVKNISFFPYLLLGVITAWSSPVFIIFQTKLQVDQKGVSYASINFLFFILNVGLTLLLLFVFKLGLMAVLLSNAATNLIFMIIAYIKLAPVIRIGYSFDLLKKMIKFALPLIPYNLSAMIAVMMDRILLNNLTNTAELGVYSVGYQFASLVLIGVSAAGQAISPWFMSVAGKDNKKIASVVEWLAVLYAVVFMSISFFSEYVLKMMVRPIYFPAESVIIFLAFGFSVYGIYILVFNGVLLKKTLFIPLITLSVMLLNVILSLLLIPKIGIQGAAIANMIANIISTIIIFVYAEKLFKIGYRKKILIIAFGTAGLITFAVKYIFTGFWIALVLKIIISIACVVTLAVLGERLKLLSIVRRR